MSIKTKYANMIFNGVKKYEYRKSSIGQSNLNKRIYIYSSKGDKTIIGYVIIDKILEGNLDYILDKTKPIEKRDIIKYFENRSKCYALHIKNFLKFKKVITLDQIKKYNNSFVLPQYYRYLKADELKYIMDIEKESI